MLYVDFQYDINLLSDFCIHLCRDLKLKCHALDQLIFFNNTCNSCRCSGSTAAKGSSNKIISAPIANVSAKATFCNSPPDKYESSRCRSDSIPTSDKAELILLSIS